MPKLERLKPSQAEQLLLKHGFILLRSKGSHRIYGQGDKRVVLPFHTGKILHPKIIKQVLTAVGRVEV